MDPVTREISEAFDRMGTNDTERAGIFLAGLSKFNASLSEIARTARDEKWSETKLLTVALARCQSRLVYLEDQTAGIEQPLPSEN